MTRPASFANAPTPEATPALDPMCWAEPSPSPSCSPRKAKPVHLQARPPRMAPWPPTERLRPTALPYLAASERAAAAQRTKPILANQEEPQPRKAASEQRALRKAVWERGVPLPQSRGAWERGAERIVPDLEGPSERKTAWVAAEMRAALPQGAAQKPTLERRASESVWVAG